MAANVIFARPALTPFIESLELKLQETHPSIAEFTAVLVMLKHESLITNAFLSRYTKNPIRENLKSVREIQNAFEALHSLLNRIDAGEASRE